MDLEAQRPRRFTYNQPWRALLATKNLVSPALKLAGRTLGYAASEMPVVRGRYTPYAPRKKRVPFSVKSPSSPTARGRAPGRSLVTYQSVATQTGRRNGKRVINQGTGYTGKFRKAKKSGVRYDSKFQRADVTLHRETPGILSDSNCVYIGHGSGPSDMLFQAVSGAILRKLLARAGISVLSLR